MARRIRERLALQPSEAVLSGRRIASTQGVSRNSVSEVLIAKRGAGIGWRETEAVTCAEAYERLFPRRALSESVCPDPDRERVHRELAWVGATLKRLHEEYWDEAREGRAVHVLRQVLQALSGVHGEQAGREPRRVQGGKGVRGRLGGADNAARRSCDGRGFREPSCSWPALQPHVLRRADAGHEREDKLLRCYMHAFVYIGGSAPCIAPDNLKPA